MLIEKSLFCSRNTLILKKANIITQGTQSTIEEVFTLHIHAYVYISGDENSQGKIVSTRLGSRINVKMVVLYRRKEKRAITRV